MQEKLTISDFVDLIIRPMVNVDGGDIRFDKIIGNTVYLIAGAECANCRGCGPNLSFWLQTEINQYFQSSYQIHLSIEKPYYYQ